MCKIKELIVDTLKAYWSVAVVPAIYIALFIWYFVEGKDNPAGMATHNIVLLWKDVGLSLTALYVSLVLLIPTISFKNKEIKREFIDKHINSTISLSGWCLGFSAVASLIEPITCELSSKSDSKEWLWLWGLVGGILLVSLIFSFIFFMRAIVDICRLYKKDVAEQVKAEEAKQKVDLTVL